VRNLIVYGDLTGTANVNKFYQLNLQAPGFTLAQPEQLNNFVESTWNSFWGVFGWQSVLMPNDYYLQAGFFSQLFLGLTALAALGLIVWRFVRWWRFREGPVIAAHVWQAATLLVVTGVVLVIAFVQYSVTVAIQSQGRYLF